MTATVNIYLGNQRTYRRGDIMLHALSLNSPLPACGHNEMLLDIIASQLSRAKPTTTWAQDYLAMGYRPLTVGDVIVIETGETVAWTVTPGGWRKIDGFLSEIC